MTGNEPEMKHNEEKTKQAQRAMKQISLLLLPLSLAKRLPKSVVRLGRAAEKIFPAMKQDLLQAGVRVAAAEYIIIALLNAMLWGIMVSALSYVLSVFVAKRAALDSAVIAVLSGFAILVVMLLVVARYPRILARKKAELVDKNLMFALKDMLMQARSGVTLYNAILNIAHGDYGSVSEEFYKVAKKVRMGTPLSKALGYMAKGTRSEFLRKTTWQLVNSLKAGASVRSALTSVLAELKSNQRSRIRNYGQELNVWSLLYMLFAVAIPSLGVTSLIILSSFFGEGLGESAFMLFIALTLLVQLFIIGFIKSRRPAMTI